MTPDRARRALGILIRGLAETASGPNDLSPADALRLLTEAGLTIRHTATQDHVEAASPPGITLGEEFLALTDFALDCRRAAGDPA